MKPRRSKTARTLLLAALSAFGLSAALAGDQSGEKTVDAAGSDDVATLASLGDPVAAPAGLPASYSPAKLRTAFIAMSEKQGLRVEKLAVDESEFPYLVYGVLAGQVDFHVFEDGLHHLKGYVYSGSMTGETDGGATSFALNMIPSSQYPKGQVVACTRRLMARLKLLADQMERGGAR